MIKLIIMRAIVFFYRTFKEKQTTENEIFACFQESVHFRSASQTTTTPETKMELLLIRKFNHTEDPIIWAFYLDFLNYPMHANKKD